MPVSSTSIVHVKNDQKVLQHGRSMIEMLGVLAIVGVLSVGGIAGYSKAMEKFKINKTVDQMSQIITNIRTSFKFTAGKKIYFCISMIYKITKTNKECNNKMTPA